MSRYTFKNLKNINQDKKDENDIIKINNIDEKIVPFSFTSDKVSESESCDNNAIFISYGIEEDIESKNFININTNNTTNIKNALKMLLLVSTIKININGTPVIFYKKSIKNGNTSLYFIDSSYKYFMKIPLMYTEYDLLRREIFILKKLEQYDCFPKIVYNNNILLVTEYIGDIITKQSIPDNILFQINDINNILIKEKIIHSDIKQSEMLIKDNKLYIIDFGWARYNNKWSCDSGFSNKTKPNLDNTSDLQSMINIIIKLLN
jgi:predicted Ser/Thr protein kinase